MNKGSIVKEIERLRKEKKAIILAHYYQIDEVQDIADHVGDSLELSQMASTTDAEIIVFAGVHFMAETAKIIAPDKKVLIPDLNAGCSLADSCNALDFEQYIVRNPNRTVISYINTTAAVKALTDIVCTSSNALKIVESLPENEKIIFGPDRNLGNYIKSKTGRDMLIWDGYCHVHEEFSVEKIIELKEKNPEYRIIAHPECIKPLQIMSDFVGSTSALLNYVGKSKDHSFIVATEPGIIYQMNRENPEKMFIPAPPKDSTCACSECQYMKMITVEKIYDTLVDEKYEISLPNETIEKAGKPIMKMLEISRNLSL